MIIWRRSSATAAMMLLALAFLFVVATSGTVTSNGSTGDCNPDVNIPTGGPVRGICFHYRHSSSHHYPTGTGTGATGTKTRRRGRYFPMIPYGAPPVGHKRWTHATPAAPWPNEPRLDLSKIPTRICPQPLMPGTNFVTHAGVEDCLTLAVWTPAIGGGPTNSIPNRLYPVMVYFTGGSFASGYATMPLYNASSLVDPPTSSNSKTGGPVVVVNVNYRTGLFGGLAHVGLGSHTNFGFTDQRLALRWVQSNIAAFGGDPNRVTIFGESAGGSYIYMHLVAGMHHRTNKNDDEPKEKLFHRAIAQSGMPGLPLLSLAEAQHLRGVALEQRLNCTRHTPEESLSCMRLERSVTQVIEAIQLGGCPARPGEWSMVGRTL